jgi:hypothetical protein
MVLGWELYSDRWLAPDRALELLGATPDANMPIAEKRDLVAAALEEIQPLLSTDGGDNGLRKALQERARELEEAHRRVRQSVGQPARGLAVELNWPPDLLGVLVLQPMVGGTQ